MASLALMNPRLLHVEPPHLVLVVSGAALMVVVLLGWSAAGTLGQAVPVQWLGKRSFSLYLTHEPVILSIAVTTGWTHPAAILVSAVPLCLLTCTLFYRAVEEPSHGASRGLGKHVQAAAARYRPRSMPDLNS